jgi:hypothetical protein
MAAPLSLGLRLRGSEFDKHQKHVNFLTPLTAGVVSRLFKSKDGCCDYFLRPVYSAHKAPSSSVTRIVIFPDTTERQQT